MKQSIISCLLAILAFGSGAYAQNACTPTCTPADSAYCTPEGGSCCGAACCATEQWQGKVVAGTKTYKAAATLHLAHNSPYALVSIKELGILRQRYSIRKQGDGRLLFTAQDPASGSLVSSRPNRVL